MMASFREQGGTRHDGRMGLRDFIMKKVPGLSVDEVLQALSKGSVLIDVRTPGEYEAGHAPGSRPVDPKELSGDDPLFAVFGDDPLAERDAPIVVICDNGLRSSVAAAQLRDAGYLAQAVSGGLLAWRNAGHPVIPGPYRGRR